MFGAGSPLYSRNLILAPVNGLQSKTVLAMQQDKPVDGGGGETKHKRSGMAVNRTAVVELSIFSGKVFIGQLPILLGRSS